MRKSKWLILALLVLVADQITKLLVLHNVTQPIVITSFFSIVFAGNTGAAFSFLANASGWQMWLFGGIALIISIVLIIWLFRLPRHKIWLPTALMLILGGALGNVLDRVMHGFVVDFLLFHIDQWSWPAFNLADTAIVIGAIMLVLEVLFNKKQA